MKRAKYLYHTTPTENVESILKHGLIPCGGKRIGAFVCLSTKPSSWHVQGNTLLRICTDGLDHIKANTFLPESDEVLFWGSIPPESISVVK